MLLNPEQSRRLIEHALQKRYALLAVNADSHAAVYDCLAAARSMDAPIIIETSLWQLQGRGYGAGDALLGLQRYLADLAVLGAAFPDVPVIYHTDHIKGPQTMSILKAAIAGVAVGQTTLRASTISLDSSEMTVEQNLAALSELCSFATHNGLSLTLEIEAGVDAGVSPIEDCEILVGQLEKMHPGYLALWAPGVGTQHGLHGDGYPTFSAEAVAAHQKKASEIAGRPIGIALHGSSGLPEKSLRAAVDAGVAKVNWSSESLLIRSQAAQTFFAQKSAQLERSHPEWKATAMDNGVLTFISTAYVPAVAARLELLGATNQASAFLTSLSESADVAK